MSHIQVTAQGRQLAYNRSLGRKDRPGIVFLGGFKSDKEGTKALFLESWAAEQNLSFLRFDYSGHGSSSGRFEDGAIGDWAEDAEAMIEAQTDGPQILVGSSMGGWISLLMARRIPARISGLVGIAAAPDFTRATWESLTPAEQDEAKEKGAVALPSGYGEPYVFTRRLFEDGAQHLIFDQPLNLPFPVRFLQGTEDEAVSQEVALKLLAHSQGPDIRLSLVKGADHRFSAKEDLDLIAASVAEILENV